MYEFIKWIWVVLLICGGVFIFCNQLWAFKSGPYLGGALGGQCVIGDAEYSVKSPNTYEHETYASHDLGTVKDSLEVFGGWLFPFCNDRVFVGVESYACSSTHFDTVLSQITLSSIGMISYVQRDFGLGLLLKGGTVVWDDYFVYGIIGPEIGFFTWEEYSFRGLGSDVSAEMIMPGIRLGWGVERDFSWFRLGLQVDFTHYPSAQFNDIDDSNYDHQFNIQPNFLNVSLRCSIPFA